MTKELAWYKPSVNSDTYKVYTDEDLKSSKKVVELFDYCQILLGFISAEGWSFLFHYHSIDELVEINRRSGWFTEEDDTEVLESMIYWSLVAGYNPVSDDYGKYNEETGVFSSKSGDEKINYWGGVMDVECFRNIWENRKG